MNSLHHLVRHTFSVLVLAFILNACTDADPKVSQLKNLENFDLTTPQIATSDLTAVAVVAKCSAFITSVDVSLDGGASWTDALTYDPTSTVNCTTTKEFKITLSQTRAPWSAMAITAGTTLPVQFRAHSRMGTQILRNLNVLFTPGVTTSQEVLIGGKLLQTGTGLQMRSRARFQQQSVATGGGLILKGRISQ
jgi:hypothetical protein